MTDVGGSNDEGLMLVGEEDVRLKVWKDGGGGEEDDVEDLLSLMHLSKQASSIESHSS